MLRFSGVNSVDFLPFNLNAFLRSFITDGLEMNEYCTYKRDTFSHHRAYTQPIAHSRLKYAFCVQHLFNIYCYFL